MKRLCVALTAFGLAVGSAAAAVDAPAQGYREAYRLVREAKMADYNGNADLAGWKWHEAKMLLEKLSREYPNWNRDVVRGQLSEAARWLSKSPPSSAQSYAMSVEETRGLAGSVAEFNGTKVSMLKQIEWEKQKLVEIERLVRDFGRKENARRVLGLEKGALVTLADIKRAEAAEPTPTPVNEKKLAQEEEKEEDLSKIDSDNDGLTDAEEEKLGTDTKKADTDRDGLTDGDEVKTYKTDPLDKDTDGDGWEDGDEVKDGFDPLDADSPGYPPS